MGIGVSSFAGFGGGGDLRGGRLGSGGSRARQLLENENSGTPRLHLRITLPNSKPKTSRSRSSPGNPQLPHSETPNTLKKSTKNPNPQTPLHHNPPPVPRIQLPQQNQNQTQTKSRGTFKALPRHSHPRTPSTTLHHECNAILLCSSPTLEQGQCSSSSSKEAVSNFGALERCECGWPQQQESWSWSRFQGVYFLTYTHTYKNGKDSIGVYHSRAVV